MYKIEDEYKDQAVVCFMKNGDVIKLDIATQTEFAEVYKVKGWQKFISKSDVKDEKEVKKVIKEVKKDAKK